MWTILTTEAFDDWYANLRDAGAARRIQARIDRAALGKEVAALEGWLAATAEPRDTG